MKKILVFGASSSKSSINQKFATYAASQLPHFEPLILDLNDFEMPIFSVDRERKNGIPTEAQQFKEHIRNADGILISLAEHNASYSAAFKNILDWTSRMEGGMWLEKPMLLLATSPGARGAQLVLESAKNRFPFMKGRVIATFSLPSFENNFSDENGITDPDLERVFRERLAQFSRELLEG